MRDLLQTNKNIIILTLFFSLIFFYYLHYPIESSKAFILNLGSEKVLKDRYILWGLLNDYIFQFAELLIGNFISGIYLIEFIIAFQLSIIWSFTILKIQNDLNIFALITFLNPLVLNYFSLCTRDAIALALLFLLFYKSWNKLKFLISLIITSIHIGNLPLIITSSFVYFNRAKSKRFFLTFTIFSILFAILAHFLLRYSDVVYLLPEGKYREPLFFPKMGISEEGGISNLIGRAYNVYGEFNYKILFFGILGQIFTIFFKNKFPKNTFSICFSVFFVCSSLSSIPNADRFIYHAVLLSFPYLISFSFEYLNIIFNKLNRN